MGSMAVIHLIGNVGGDPEIRKTATGEVCTFNIAINRRRGNEEFTDWYRAVIFFDKLIDTVEKYVKKGSSVAIWGEPGQQKWEDREGQEKVTFEVLVAKLLLNDQGGGAGARDTRGGDRRDDRGRDDRGRDDRGRDDRGRDAPRSNGRDRDDRGARRDDDRGAVRGARDDRSRTAARDDRPRDDRRPARDDPPARSPGGGSIRNDIDDEIPFLKCWQ